MVLKWTPELELGIEAMDLTHREFVEQLNALVRAPDDMLAEDFARLIDHTRAHFGRENAWMKKRRFAGAEAHVSEHDRVLRVMTAIADFMESGEPRMGRMVARELAAWFRQHALNMDAELAQFLRTVDAGAGAAASTPSGAIRRKRASRSAPPVSPARIKGPKG